ncbi:MAG: HAD-IIA family hydrolase [Hydrogenimonas sp.]|nr:HAD-IIA family hydrolase [Hydrogenimonas sp.]
MSLKGLMIDVQGTLIDDIDKRPIDGAVETLSALKEGGVPFVLVTNNTKRESEDFKEFLRGSGFSFDDNQYLDPLMVLESSLPPSSVAAYGTKHFLELLQKRGYTLDYKSPEAVLVSVKDDYCSDEFAAMIEALLSGARLVGMHETSLYAKNGRRYPGVGAILKMLSFATGRDYFVVGKPSDKFYAEALKMLQRMEPDTGWKDVTVISDDLAGDLKGARRMGMRTALVLSGKVKSLQEAGELCREWKPDLVAQNIGEWFKSYEEGAA